MLNPIRENYQIVIDELLRLRRLLLDCEPVVAQVAVLPDTPAGESDKPVEVVKPVHYRGRIAVEKALERYLDLHNEREQCHRSARRSVGVVQLCPAQSELARDIPGCVERINSAKTAIKDYLVQTYECRFERFHALRAECPGIMTLHLYRQIRCLHNMDIQKIHFTWQRKRSLVRVKSKNDLIKTISGEIERLPEEYGLPMRELLNAVKATPTAQLRLRRSVQPQVSANYWIEDKIDIFPAPMPILVVQEQPVGTKQLRDFIAARPQNHRLGDKLAAQQLGVLKGVTVERVLE